MDETLDALLSFVADRLGEAKQLTLCVRNDDVFRDHRVPMCHHTGSFASCSSLAKLIHKPSARNKQYLRRVLFL